MEVEKIVIFKAATPEQIAKRPKKFYSYSSVSSDSSSYSSTSTSSSSNRGHNEQKRKGNK